MITLSVDLGDRSYPIRIAPGLLARIPFSALDIVPATAVAILTHPRLGERYAAPLLEGFARRGVRAEVILLPPGERHKNLAAVGRIYDRMVSARLDRQSLLIALGGGVVGDVGGFAAATYLRGIPFIQVPTTLLAQVDASVGGKTGVMPKGFVWSWGDSGAWPDGAAKNHARVSDTHLRHHPHPDRIGSRRS